MVLNYDKMLKQAAKDHATAKNGKMIMIGRMGMICFLFIRDSPIAYLSSCKLRMDIGKLS